MIIAVNTYRHDEDHDNIRQMVAQKKQRHREQLEVLTITQDVNLSFCAWNGHGGAMTDRSRKREVFYCCLSWLCYLIEKTETAVHCSAPHGLSSVSRTAWACSPGGGRSPRKRADCFTAFCWLSKLQGQARSGLVALRLVRLTLTL